jgi:hypothetical protein
MYKELTDTLFEDVAIPKPLAKTFYKYEYIIARILTVALATRLRIHIRLKLLQSFQSPLSHGMLE